MKKWILATSFVIAISVCSYAQNTDTTGQRTYDKNKTTKQSSSSSNEAKARSGTDSTMGNPSWNNQNRNNTYGTDTLPRRDSMSNRTNTTGRDSLGNTNVSRDSSWNNSNAMGTDTTGAMGNNQNQPVMGADTTSGKQKTKTTTPDGKKIKVKTKKGDMPKP